MTLARFAFVKASWHADIVDQALRGFLEVVPSEHVEIFDVPGAFEMPLLARDLARSGRYAAIAAAALVVDGGIYRHDFVARAVVEGLMRAGLDSGVPILSVSLTLTTTVRTNTMRTSTARISPSRDVKRPKPPWPSSLRATGSPPDRRRPAAVSQGTPGLRSLATLLVRGPDGQDSMRPGRSAPGERALGGGRTGSTLLRPSAPFRPSPKAVIGPAQRALYSEVFLAIHRDNHFERGHRAENVAPVRIGEDCGRRKMNIWASIILWPGADPAVDRIVKNAKAEKLTIVFVTDVEQAAEVAVELVDDEVELIELCGGFGLEAGAIVSRAVAGRAAVGTVAFGIDSITQAAAYKAKFDGSAD